MWDVELLGRNFHDFRNSLVGKWSITLLNFFDAHAFCQTRQDEGNRESSAPNSQLATQKPRVRDDPLVVLKSQRFSIAHDITYLRSFQEPAAARLPYQLAVRNVRPRILTSSLSLPVSSLQSPESPTSRYARFRALLPPQLASPAHLGNRDARVRLSPIPSRNQPAR